MAERPTVLPGRITRLRVRNYRSLADVDVTLEPLTVLVGPNGAGKSNLLDVLRFVRDALFGRLDQAVDRRGGMGALRRWSAKGRPFDVRIELWVEGEDWWGEYAFTLGSERRGEYRVKGERCRVGLGEQVREYEIKDGRWERRPTPSSALLDLAAQASDLAREELQEELVAIPTNALYLPQAALLLGDPAYLQLWNWLRNMGFYNLYPIAFREPQKPTNPYPLQDDGRNLVSTLRALRREHREAVERILRFLRAAVPGVREVSVRQVGSYLVGQVHRRAGPAEGEGRTAVFDLAQESDGTLRLLALFTALFQEPSRSLIGIEEPELNIHPGALAVLRDALFLASERSQILLTTHSPDLLYDFPPEAFRVVELVDGCTEVGPMSDYQRETIRDRLFSAGELLRLEGLQREAADA